MYFGHPRVLRHHRDKDRSGSVSSGWVCTTHATLSLAALSTRSDRTPPLFPAPLSPGVIKVVLRAFCHTLTRISRKKSEGDQEWVRVRCFSVNTLGDQFTMATLLNVFRQSVDFVLDNSAPEECEQLGFGRAVGSHEYLPAVRGYSWWWESDRACPQAPLASCLSSPILPVRSGLRDTVLVDVRGIH